MNKVSSWIVRRMPRCLSFPIFQAEHFWYAIRLWVSKVLRIKVNQHSKACTCNSNLTPTQTCINRPRVHRTLFQNLPLKIQNAVMCITDALQATSFSLREILQKRANDQSSSITKGSFYYIKHA